MRSIEALIRREQNDAWTTGYQRIIHIRVTVDALPGSLVTVPITPERARAVGCLVAVEGYGVVANPKDYETMLELLIHPQDWMTLLEEAGPVLLGLAGPPDRIFGIPVLR